MTQSVSIQSSMREQRRRTFMRISLAISLFVYVACLAYAGVRSYSLFSITIDQSLILLALLGIIALEFTALGLPIAIHFWTSPGIQRIVAYIFYALDLAMIGMNAVVDAARHSGALLPEYFVAYGTFAVPALPVFCMIGWALIWVFDPASREADMIASVQSSTFESMLNSIREATDMVDITSAVKTTAEEAARALVGETLGRAPKRTAEARVTTMQVSQPAAPAVVTPLVVTPNGHPELEGFSIYGVAKALSEQYNFSQIDGLRAACLLTKQTMPPASEAQLVSRVKRVQRLPNVSQDTANVARRSLVS